MTDQATEIRVQAQTLLEKAKHSDTATSLEATGRELANLVNDSVGVTSTNNQLWKVVSTVFKDAISDTSMIDFYAHLFRHLLAHLSNQVQDEEWADGKKGDILHGADLGARMLAIELREHVNTIDVFLPDEFRRQPDPNPVISSDEDTATAMRRILATDIARSKFVNVNRLIGRLWALDVLDLGNMVKMLLGSYCDTDSDMDSQKELDIESACAMIRAAGEKLEVRVGKQNFDAYLDIIEKVFRRPESCFSLKVTIAETLKLHRVYQTSA